MGGTLMGNHVQHYAGGWLEFCHARLDVRYPSPDAAIHTDSKTKTKKNICIYRPEYKSHQQAIVRSMTTCEQNTFEIKHRNLYIMSYSLGTLP